MVRPEISAGVRQISQQLHRRAEVKRAEKKAVLRKTNFLRRFPPWLLQFQLQGSNFGVEVAGVDPDVSEITRGVALQLESWTAEYKSQKDAPVERPLSQRRRLSRSSSSIEPPIKVISPPGSPLSSSPSTDGRRLALHVRGLDGFIVEGLDTLEPESFISLPRFEIAFSTSDDGRGPIFHLNSNVKAFYFRYSLYRYYAVGLAMAVLKQAFDNNHSLTEVFQGSESSTSPDHSPSPSITNAHELTTVDIKAGFLQIKSSMPSDPPLMLQAFGMEVGMHRWSAPFVKARLMRLYAEAPQIQAAWARIASVKNVRLDLRESRRKHGMVFINEKSMDVTTDFIRLAIPHQLVLHKIFDNIANVLKATEQLHHRFKTGTNEYILKKPPERPRKVPRVSLRSKVLLFEIEDGPFEWKLGSIYRL
ncbi:MAG: hypothetical protein Q9214_007429, partial [Letrouitia sp. 1 TL-2023]